MIIFDPKLDLRGCTVRLCGDGMKKGPVVTIPLGCKRDKIKTSHIMYFWHEDNADDVVIVYQNSLPTNTRSFRDIVDVLPSENNSKLYASSGAQAEIDRLSALLQEAVGYLREAKCSFAPNTTNSLVDTFLERFDATDNNKEI